MNKTIFKIIISKEDINNRNYMHLDAKKCFHATITKNAKKYDRNRSKREFRKNYLNNF